MLKLKILEVNQPFGSFYVAKLKASELLKIAESDPYRVLDNGQFAGVQRPRQESRLKEIAEYLSGTESALPNSIVIAGNTSSSLDEDRWTIMKEGDEKFLLVPKLKINGTIIDGQHRVNGFRLLNEEKQEKYELVCSIYLDIPNPYQAFLFATINMNQKKVDKSLAYELYGYNLDEENSNAWSSEKLAVFLTRKLNFDEDSIFKHHILVAAENDDILFEVSPKNQEWYVSTATIVDGILSLITTNQKRDRDKLQQLPAKERRREALQVDSSPLRQFYLQNNDKLIYTAVKNFFTASFDLLYKRKSYIFKTVGIQAQFSVLKKILQNELENRKDISVEYFKEKLAPAVNVDFSNNFYTASGVGKSRILNSILILLDYKDVSEISKIEERENYRKLLKIK